MAKINFSRVEEIIDKEIRKMKRDELLTLADEASGKKSKKKSSTPLRIMIIVEQDLKWLKKKDPQIYKKLDINKSRIQEIFKIIKDQRVSEKLLKEIQNMRLKIKKFREKHYPQISDEEIIESEKKKHINKRQNVNEKWLPLK